MKTLLLALLIIPLAYTQQLQPVESVQPDCGKFIAPITTAGTFNSATVNNKDGAGCDGWVVTYSSFGFATVSVLLQDAPLTTAGAAGTFVSFAGTIVTGFVNPTTATTQGEIRATGYFPYVRVRITTTGTGYLTAEFHGFKNNPNSGSGAPSGSGGCPGTVGTPCVVDGPTAVGSPVTFAPVQMGGQDSNGLGVTNIQTDANGALLLGSSGDAPQGDGTLTANLNMLGSPTGPGFNTSLQTIPFLFNGTTWDRARGNAAGGTFVQGPTAAGSPPAGRPVLVGGSDGTNVATMRVNTDGAAVQAALTTSIADGDPNNNAQTPEGFNGGTTQSLRYFVRPYLFNGSTWDRQFLCPNQVLVTLADATLTALVTVSGATVIRVCSVHVTTSGAAETVSLLQGTGVACAGSPVTIDAYLGVTAFVSDYSPNGALRTAASNGLCVQQSGAAQAAKVWVSYAQF